MRKLLSTFKNLPPLLHRSAVLLAIFGAMQASAADDNVWAGLIYATNEAKPAKPPAPLATVAPKLRKIFGYNQFTLLGEARRSLKVEKGEAWLIAGKPFALSVEAKEIHEAVLEGAPRVSPGFGSMPNSSPRLAPASSAPAVSYRLKLVLYQGEKYIVQTDVELDRRSPVLIRGPLFADGQLILILQVD